MPRPKKLESERKKAVSLMLSPKTIQALDYFSEMVHLSKSVIVSLALSQYLEKKDEFRNNPKVKELLKDTDFYTVETE